MQPIYSVPVIPNNLRHEETVVQIADALSYLCQVFEDITERVNNRIHEKQQFVSELKQRIEKTNKKVTKLTSTRKATQVFSSSKYPASELNSKYKCVFNSSGNVQLNRTRIKLKGVTPCDKPQTDKLQFYHVKINDAKKKFKTNKYSLTEEGLGCFPNDANFINELLLFNTSKNPYKNYVMSDPLYQICNVQNQVAESDQPNGGPDAAPLSISQRVESSRAVTENYFYTPGLGEVPSIDVPLDLPDLPGIADDLRYLMESGPGIAPSVTTTPLVPDLPFINQSPVVETDVSVIVASNTPTNKQVNLSEPSITPKAEVIVEPVMDKVDVPLPKVSKIQTAKVEEIPQLNDARANLMEAIRQAGGLKKANLRAADMGSKENISTNPENSQATGVDLMADLHAKLALRRKGISGTKNSDGSLEVSSAMTRISAMIPPPVPATNELTESTATEEDDAEWDE